jgi:hypothetical protein
MTCQVPGDAWRAVAKKNPSGGAAAASSSKVNARRWATTGMTENASSTAAREIEACRLRPDSREITR